MSLTQQFLSIDELLRGDEKFSARTGSIRRRLWILITGGCCYGAIMGTYGGLHTSRLAQISYSAIKVPLLLSATFWISLPSFFVLNTLLGLRNDFRAALSALLGTQAALTVILASFAPFTALWYISGSDYANAILFNGCMFAAASFVAQVVLRRAYGRLIERNPRHRWMLRIWLVIYMFVGIQMGWVLRPFIGNPALSTRFLRGDAMTNAYVTVGQLLWEKLQ